jgi:hypothetical protein
MLKSLPRRKRHVVLAAILVIFVLVVILLAIRVFSPTETPYVPGEEIGGLTSALARNIPEGYPDVSFSDVTREAGIEFQHFWGKRTSQLPEDMGSGAAWGDYDNDGWLDLFVANLAGPLTMTSYELEQSPANCVLFHNEGDGSFNEVSVKAGVAVKAWANGCAWGDYDKDGSLDLFVSCYGQNYLFKNNRDGTFRDVSRMSNVSPFEGFWTGVSWSDYNRDGFPDIYVCGYVKYNQNRAQDLTLQYDVEVPTGINPSSFSPERNLLFTNNRNGTFTENAMSAGIADSNGRSLSAAWCDFDEDGWQDLYVANDVSDNVLFRNLGDGTFEEISHQALVADYRGAMGVAIGDWDGDMDLDMFITHWIAQENALYNNMRSQFLSLNRPVYDIRFMDEADRFGLGQIALDYIGWGTSFFDYDNDRKLDLFVVNGSTFQTKENAYQLVPMRDQLFWNKGAEDGFYDVSLVSGEVFHKSLVGRGSAIGDYDNDGDPDIFIVNNGGPAQLLRNECRNNNNWLQVKLNGRQNTTCGLGSSIRVITNGFVQIRKVGAQCSYCSQNSMTEHFGIGQAGSVDTLEITWLDGQKQVFTGISTNQMVNIVEGDLSIQEDLNRNEEAEFR